MSNNPGFVELREIQYAKEVAETIANSNFKVYLNSDVLLMTGLARNIAQPSKQGKKGYF